jgi:hypothetical protein
MFFLGFTLGFLAGVFLLLAYSYGVAKWQYGRDE